MENKSDEEFDDEVAYLEDRIKDLTSIYKKEY